MAEEECRAATRDEGAVAQPRTAAHSTQSAWFAPRSVGVPCYHRRSLPTSSSS